MTHNTHKPNNCFISDSNNTQENNTMNTTPDTTTNDSQAVVDFTVEEAVAAADAGSDVAYEGDMDKNVRADFEAAYQEICTYGSQDADDEGWWKPVFDVNGDFDTMATNMSQISGESRSNVLSKIQRKLVSHRFDANARDARRREASQFLGGVSLDTAGDGEYPQDRGHPAVPAVLFYEIAPGTANYVAEEYDEDGVLSKGGRTAMAVWFQPELEAGTKFASNPNQSKSGRWYSDDSFIDGYLGVVAWFATHNDAIAARTELLRAVKTLHRGVHETSRREDPVQDAHDDPDDSESRNKRKQARQQRASMAF